MNSIFATDSGPYLMPDILLMALYGDRLREGLIVVSFCGGVDCGKCRTIYRWETGGDVKID